MEIDKAEFAYWMKRIMDRFDILQNSLHSRIKDKESLDGEELLDNQDVLQKLKISARSLQRYRSTGKLNYYTISGKIYYKLSDVNDFIRSGFSNSIERQKTKKDI
ncbi:excisionase [Chryseobacterium sp. IHB B 17019]|uniref:helix-turn-helix domain-containing protein n=1 Tax=Chryseobacterium sp. IHB B 17019 TaxID=1721091 RepID=UPI00071EECDE|nr:helix-turn-helix domain-containing protein [Chryseobacterium sp. IHB B 17019]ALR29220.1 excisionase [Chryseobacterium sp. IHB B 17019]